MGKCSCMAGADSTCSHVAAPLSKLETAIHLRLKESTAPISMLCLWKSCEKVFQPAPLKLINFSRVKTHELPGDQNISATLNHYGTKGMDTGSAKATGHVQQTSSEIEEILPEPLT